MRVTLEVHTPRWLVSISRTHRIIGTAVLAIALALVPTVALADHMFTDVPSTHPQHDTISRVVAAGIMLPCTPTTFCPGNPVLRGQQAGQWDRALGLNGVPTAGTYVSRAVRADNLDGLDSTAFGQPIRFANQSIFGTLASGENFFMGVAFTPSLSGRCVVTASAQVNILATTESGPFFRLAVTRGTAAPVNDNLYGHYLQASSSTRSNDVTRTTNFQITAGQSTAFGVYFGFPSTAWVGKATNAHLSYSCTTNGNATDLSTSTPSGAEAAQQ